MAISRRSGVLFYIGLRIAIPVTLHVLLHFVDKRIGSGTHDDLRVVLIQLDDTIGTKRL